MTEEQRETMSTVEDAEEAEATTGKAKSKRTHGERALASVRAAKRGQREVSEPVERAQFLLAEANVLALLDVADALGGSSARSEE
jgi:hypothetical protein